MQTIYKIYNLLERIDSGYRDYSFLNEAVLLEAMSLDDVHQKYYYKIPEETFYSIISADPTVGDEEDRMGKYSKWLLALYTSGNLKLEDLYKAKTYLTIFHKYKQKLEQKDIGQYKSLPELYKAIEPYSDNTQAASHKEEIRKIKEGAEKVYEDDEWLVVVPHTEAAAIEYGRGTQWCTAAEHSDNYFDYYNNQGPLYININKKDGTKYQFHFETKSFMDESDNTFTFDEYHPRLSDGLIDFYTKKYGKGPLLNLLYDVVYYLSSNTDYVLVKLDEKWNFVDTENYELRSKVWFDYMFCDFTASNKCVVGLKGKFNIVDGDGTILLDKWYDDIVQSTATDTFSVMDGEKYAIMDGNCNFVTDFVFDDVSPMTWRGKLANKQWVMVVTKNGKKNIVDDKIQFLLKDWYDEIDFLFRDYVRVYKDGGNMTTILDLSTDTAAIPKWYNHIGHFKNLSVDNRVAAAIICSNGKQNYLATDGINKFWELYDVWFDGVSNFGQGNFGTAIGRIGERFYTLYNNGEYHERQKPIF